MTPSQQAFLDSEDNIKIHGGTMELPNKFEFIVDWSARQYSAEVQGDRLVVSWLDSVGGVQKTDQYTYSLQHAKRYIQAGDWKIVGAAPVLETKDLLSKIKDFINNTGIEVLISKDGYRVFYVGGDAPAVAETDEELEEIMEAILVWNNADTKLKDAAYILQQYAETYER